MTFISWKLDLAIRCCRFAPVHFFRLSSTLPQVGVEEVPIGKAALAQGEAVVLEEGIGPGEGARGQAGDDPEEAVHEPVDGAGAGAAQTGLGEAEIGEQPGGAGLGGGGEAGDYAPELAGPETVEEEIGDDEVEGAAGERAVEGVGVDKLDGGGVEAGAAEALARELEHALAGIEAGDAGLGQLAAAFEEEVAVAFAENQNGLAVGDAVEESGAAALQFGTREHEFEPAIMGREDFKAHGVAAGRSQEWRCHQSPAAMPPAT